MFRNISKNLKKNSLVICSKDNIKNTLKHCGKVLTNQKFAVISNKIATTATCLMLILIVSGSLALNPNTVFAVSSPEESVEPINFWWKADLSNYDNVSLVEYGEVEVQERIKQNQPIIEYFPEKKPEKLTPIVTSAPVTTSTLFTQTARGAAHGVNPYDITLKITTTTPITTTAPPVTSVIAVDPAPEVEAPVSTETVTVIPTEGSFNFVTNGWGHGVGMPQNGANFYAIYGGYDYKQILEHYYPGITIANSGLSPYEDFTVDGGVYPAVDAVAGVVSNEVNSSFAVDAIKAQAIAIYTIFKYNDNDANGLHMRTVDPKIYEIVKEVIGEACYYNGDYAMTVFSASSGTASANCCDVFVEDIPYLRSVASVYDETYDPHYGTVKELSAEYVKELIEPYFDIELSDNPAEWFEITGISDGGYVTQVNLDNQITIKGTSLRSCLNLKSSNFKIYY
jgi:hypothetical protein